MIPHRIVASLSCNVAIPRNPLRRTPWVVAIALLACAMPEAHAQATPKRVLILDSFGRDVAPFNVGVAAFRTELARELGEPVDLYEASLDAARFAEPEKEEPFVGFLRSRFAERNLDLVVPVGAPAVRFMAKYRDELFRDTPVLFMATEPRLIPPGLLKANATLVTRSVSLPGIVEEMLSLRPDTKNIVVVFGDSPLERFWVAQARKEFAQFDGRLAFTYLDGLSLEATEQRVATLPPDSFILFGMLVVDGAGVPYDGDAPLLRLHEAANAPIYGVFASQLGAGAIGGRLYEEADLGVHAARAGVEILHGKNPALIAPEIISTSTPTYDWRELRRWKIPESRLPAGSVILYREPTTWEAYRGRIIAVLALCVAQAILISLLVLNLRRRRVTERSLRESEERLQLATDAAGFGLIGLSLDSGKVWATEPTRRMLGLGEGAATVAQVRERLSLDERPAIEQDLRAAIRTGQPLQLEHQLQSPDGTTRWIAFHGRSRLDDAGAPESLMGVCLDISERKRAELEADELRGNLAHLTRVNTLGALSASFAHELNQPLGIIMGNAQAAQALLQGDSPDLNEARAILADIVAADRRAAAVITRLRALFERRQVNLQPVHIEEVIDEVLLLANGELTARGVTVASEWGTSGLTVGADRIQIQQLVLNLVLNAADAMTTNPSGSRRLRVHTSREGQFMRVTVSDEGPGLPADVDLFGAFISTKPGGLGMGLTICRAIVTAHHGEIWAESRQGSGASFHFTLPLSRPVPA